jgi:hypothetical protein
MQGAVQFRLADADVMDTGVVIDSPLAGKVFRIIKFAAVPGGCVRLAAMPLDCTNASMVPSIESTGEVVTDPGAVPAIVVL